MERLFEILSLKRGHTSIGERKFVDAVLMPYNPTIYTTPKGEVLAYALTRGDSKILWSSHIDTVHAANEDARQVVIWDKEMDMMYKNDGKPLGADDGAGVWLMLEMYDAGVPGTYMFHRGEERGCIGSRGMAEYHSDVISKHNFGIAFDRRDTCSVITHQSTGRCCSDSFGLALAEAIMQGQDTFELKLDTGGIFTDTAEYTGLISECTNVSIGYYNEHGGSEMLDCNYLQWLRDQMCSADFSALPVERDHTIKASGLWDNDDYSPYGWDWKLYSTPTPKKGKAKHYQPDPAELDYPMDADDVVNMRWRELVSWVERSAPEDVADLMMAMAEDIVYFREDNK